MRRQLRDGEFLRAHRGDWGTRVYIDGVENACVVSLERRGRFVAAVICRRDDRGNFFTEDGGTVVRELRKLRTSRVAITPAGR